MSRAHGWFSDNKTGSSFIIATVVPYLLTMVAIHERDLRSVG
jgi:hypothetical protein